MDTFTEESLLETIDQKMPIPVLSDMDLSEQLSVLSEPDFEEEVDPQASLNLHVRNVLTSVDFDNDNEENLADLINKPANTGNFSKLYEYLTTSTENPMHTLVDAAESKISRQNAVKDHGKLAGNINHHNLWNDISNIRQCKESDRTLDKSSTVQRVEAGNTLSVAESSYNPTEDALTKAEGTSQNYQYSSLGEVPMVKSKDFDADVSRSYRYSWPCKINDRVLRTNITDKLCTTQKTDTNFHEIYKDNTLNVTKSYKYLPTSTENSTRTLLDTAVCKRPWQSVKDHDEDAENTSLKLLNDISNIRQWKETNHTLDKSSAIQRVEAGNTLSVAESSCNPTEDALTYKDGETLQNYQYSSSGEISMIMSEDFVEQGSRSYTDSSSSNCSDRVLNANITMMETDSTNTLFHKIYGNKPESLDLDIIPALDDESGLQQIPDNSKRMLPNQDNDNSSLSTPTKNDYTDFQHELRDPTRNY